MCLKFVWYLEVPEFYWYGILDSTPECSNEMKGLFKHNADFENKLENSISCFCTNAFKVVFIVLLFIQNIIPGSLSMRLSVRRFTSRISMHQLNVIHSSLPLTRQYFNRGILHFHYKRMAFAILL